MAKDCFIPKLGQTVEEVTIIQWLVEDGAKVEQGQTILEVETDKAIFPIEATGNGYLHRGPYNEGDVIPILTSVAIVGKPTDQFSEEKEETAGIIEHAEQPIFSPKGEQEVKSQASSDIATSSERQAVSPRARRLADSKNIDLKKVKPTGGNGVRVVEKDVLAYLNQLSKASPLAQKIAAEEGLDLGTLVGSGPRGRIMKSDVQHNLPIDTQSPHVIPIDPNEIRKHVPLNGIRGVISKRMGHSVHTTARVTLITEVDATKLVEMRQRLNNHVAEEWGFELSYNDLLLKIVAIALKKHPYMNARLVSKAIEYLKPINIGIAVDTEHGLLVPVIQNADQKSLRMVGEESRELAIKARNRKSSHEDLTGSTFTITNLGVYGVDAFTPVINIPEAAILGVGRIAQKVVPREDQIVIRWMVTLSLVFDHRVVDGAPAARFLKFISELIEEPYLWNVALEE